MRAYEFLKEDQGLNPNKLTKEIGRFNNLISDIRNQAPLFLSNGDPVKIDPAEADRLEDLHANGQFAGRINLKTQDGKVYPISAFLKTSRYGGQAIPPGQEKTMAPTKEGAKLKPKDIGLHDQKIKSAQMGKVIQSNSSLANSSAGQAVIKLSKDISTGQTPTLPQNLHSEEIKAINDYAGEYLGVQALIQGATTFSNRGDFLEWLGTDLNNLTLMFPSASNSSIADSYALVNGGTGHQINISSKGRAGGAPPAISGLKIPEHIANKKQYAIPVKFIQLCQNTSLPQPTTVSQPFQAMNMLHQYRPDVIPEQYQEFLPWPREIVSQINNSLASKEEMPEYQHLWKSIAFRSKDSSDGGKLTHVVKTAVKDIFNSGKIPEFAPAILEILDYNFIQQDATISKGVMLFQTNWPAKINGQVTVESKSGATDPTKGSFSFKLHF